MVQEKKKIMINDRSSEDAERSTSELCCTAQEVKYRELIKTLIRRAALCLLKVKDESISLTQAVLSKRFVRDISLR